MSYGQGLTKCQKWMLRLFARYGDDRLLFMSAERAPCSRRSLSLRSLERRGLVEEVVIAQHGHFRQVRFRLTEAGWQVVRELDPSLAQQAGQEDAPAEAGKEDG